MLGEIVRGGWPSQKKLHLVWNFDLPQVPLYFWRGGGQFLRPWYPTAGREGVTCVPISRVGLLMFWLAVCGISPVSIKSYHQLSVTGWTGHQETVVIRWTGRSPRVDLPAVISNYSIRVGACTVKRRSTGADGCWRHFVVHVTKCHYGTVLWNWSRETVVFGTH